MLAFAHVVCALAGAFLPLLTWSGRPLRGEAFMGSHLISGPAAIAFSVGTGRVLWAAPLPATWANVVLALLLPGKVIAMTFLPLAAFLRHGARTVKLVTPYILLAPFGLGHGAALHPERGDFGTRGADRIRGQGVVGPVGGVAGHHLPPLVVGAGTAVRAASNLLRHAAASLALPWASYSCTRRSSASGMRVAPCGGMLASRSFMPR